MFKRKYTFLITTIILTLIVFIISTQEVSAKNISRYKTRTKEITRGLSSPRVNNYNPIRKPIKLEQDKNVIKNKIKNGSVIVGNPIKMNKEALIDIDKNLSASFNLKSNIYTINDTIKTTDLPPININGTVFLPVKLITEMLDIKPEYYEKDNNVFLEHDDFSVIISTNNGKIAFSKDDKITVLDSVVIKHNDSNYIPVKVFEEIGIKIFWNEKTQEIKLYYNCQE